MVINLGKWHLKGKLYWEEKNESKRKTWNLKKENKSEEKEEKNEKKEEKNEEK